MTHDFTSRSLQRKIFLIQLFVCFCENEGADLHDILKNNNKKKHFIIFTFSGQRSETEADVCRFLKSMHKIK